jgi:hypothetical protein
MNVCWRGVWVGSDPLIAGAIYVACRLRDPASGTIVAEGWGGLGQDLAPGQRHTVSAGLEMPDRGGGYLLEVDLVLNEVAWFSEQGNPVKHVRIQL